MSIPGAKGSPARGEIWEVGFDPTIGREQAGHRPALIVSVDDLNNSTRGLVIVIPVTGSLRGLPSHVRVDPPEGGLIKTSVIMVEQVRSVSKDRFRRRLGKVTPKTMEQVGEILQMMLGL